MVSGKPRCLNETKERIVPEDPFRPSLEGAHHYAYVVENIEATVERLAEQLGAGPFFLFENVPLENITSRGEPAEFVHHSAFGYCGGGPIELMEIVRLVPGGSRAASQAPDRGFITSLGRYRRQQ